MLYLSSSFLKEVNLHCFVAAKYKQARRSTVETALICCLCVYKTYVLWYNCVLVSFSFSVLSMGEVYFLTSYIRLYISFFYFIPRSKSWSSVKLCILDRSRTKFGAKLTEVDRSWPKDVTKLNKADWSWPKFAWICSFIFKCIKQSYLYKLRSASFNFGYEAEVHF